MTDGRFLWVAFQVDSICCCKTDESILDALQHLPKDLPEIFERILLKLKRSGSDVAMSRKIFEIVAVAHRPLDLEELREAISIDPGTSSWDAKKLVNDIDGYLGCCGSLLIVDDEHSTLHFAHHSVRQYLVYRGKSTYVREYHVELLEADMNFGEIILAYLGLDIFDKQLTMPSSNPRTYPPSHIIQASLPRSKFVGAMAIRYLKSRGKDRLDVRRQLEIAGGVDFDANKTVKNGLDNHPFFSYAENFWLFHIKMLKGSPKDFRHVWKRLIDSRSIIKELPWGPENWLELGPVFVEWVTQNKHQLLYRCVFYEQSREDNREPLALIEKNNLRGMVYLLERSSEMGFEPDTEMKC